MSNDKDAVSEYLSKDYFNPCDETDEGDAGNGLDESLLVSPLLTDYIGNITARSKSRSARKKNIEEREFRKKSATKLRARLVNKFSCDINKIEKDINTSYCSTPGSEDNNDSLQDTSCFSLGLGSPDACISFEIKDEQDKAEFRLHGVRDNTIYENEEFCDEVAKHEKIKMLGFDESSQGEESEKNKHAFHSHNLEKESKCELNGVDLKNDSKFNASSPAMSQLELKYEYEPDSPIQKCNFIKFKDKNHSPKLESRELFGGHTKEFELTTINDNLINAIEGLCNDDANIEKRVDGNDFKIENKFYNSYHKDIEKSSPCLQEKSCRSKEYELDSDLNNDLRLSLSPINLKCTSGDKESLNFEIFEESTTKAKSIIGYNFNLRKMNNEVVIEDGNLQFSGISEKREDNVNCYDKNQIVNDYQEDSPKVCDPSTPIVSFSKDCNFRVDKGFFLNEDDECDLSKVSEIDVCSSICSIEEDPDVNLDKVNDMNSINTELLALDVEIFENVKASCESDMDSINKKYLFHNGHNSEFKTLRKTSYENIENSIVSVDYREENAAIKPMSPKSLVIDYSKENIENGASCLDISPDSVKEKNLKRQKLSCFQSSNSSATGSNDEIYPPMKHTNEKNNEKIDEKSKHKDVCLTMEPQSAHDSSALVPCKKTVINREHNLRRSCSDSDFIQETDCTDNTPATMSYDDVEAATFKLRKTKRNKRRSSVHSRAGDRRDSLSSSNSSPILEQETKLRDLSSVRKRINASSSALIERLQGDAQKRKLHLSRSLKPTKLSQPTHTSNMQSKNSLETSLYRNPGKRNNTLKPFSPQPLHDSIFDRNTHGGENFDNNKDDKFRVSKKLGPSSKDFDNKMAPLPKEKELSSRLHLTRNPRSAVSKSLNSKEPSIIPIQKKKLTKEDDPFIPFKARPVPATSRGGQFGVPKVEKRPATVPCSPKLGKIDNRPSRAISNIKTEYRNRRRKLTKVPITRPPLQPSKVKKAALKAKPFQRVLAGSEASKAKELVWKKALEKEEAENRELSMFHLKPVKPALANFSPGSACNSQNCSLIGIRLLDDDSVNVSSVDLQMQENIPPTKYNKRGDEARNRNSTKKSTISFAAPPKLHSTARAKQRAEFETHRASLDVLRRNDKEKKRQTILKEKTAQNNKLRNLL